MGVGVFGGFDDFECGLIDDVIVEVLEFDVNVLVFYGGKRMRV